LVVDRSRDHLKINNGCIGGVSGRLSGVRRRLPNSALEATALAPRNEEVLT